MCARVCSTTVVSSLALRKGVQTVKYEAVNGRVDAVRQCLRQTKLSVIIFVSDVDITQAMEALVGLEEGNLVLGDDLGTGLISALEGEWRLLYTSSNAMEYNQAIV